VGDFRNLLAWQEAMRMVSVSHRAIQALPSCERFALADQWRRALYSVPLNIAEGASRRGVREFRRYLDVARGSLHELEVILEIAAVQRYLSDDQLGPIRACRDSCARLVYGLLERMARSSRSRNES
jgi:four helix bundle protein